MRLSILALVTCAVLAGCSTADWLDRSGDSRNTSITELTQQEIVAGLKQALGKGVDYAVTTLGREGGFLQNFQVRIPLPERLQPVERTLRSLGQGQLVEEFRA